MQVGTLAVQHLLEKDVLYLVPLYQRPYVWNQTEQWEPLWADIQRLAEAILRKEQPRAHFLGATVQDRAETAPGQIETRLLIDGQQRLTTLQLLLKAFGDVVKESGNDRYALAIEKLSRNNHPLSTLPHQSYKVWPTNADRADFEHTMEAGAPPALLKSFGLRADAARVGRNIPDAYLFFFESISDWLKAEDQKLSAEKIAALYSAIRDNVRLVVIDLDEKDDAQLIFETLNARGTPLLAADLVKNAILNEIRNQNGDIDEAYRRYWQQFDNNAPFWRKEVGRGHARRARVEVFLQYVLTLLTKGDVAAGHLYAAYTEYALSPNAGTALERLAHFKRYGGVYEKLQGKHESSRIQLFMERLNAMDVTTAYPFLLALFDMYGEEDATLAPVLRHLESFLIRRMVCRLSTRGYNRKFVDLTSALEGSKSGLSNRVSQMLAEGTAEFDRWPSDSEFEQAWLSNPLYEILSRPRMRMILEAMEMNLRNKFAESTEVPRGLTIEHIMPQNWSAYWPLTASDTSAEAVKDRRNSLIHTVGNLTLLNGSLNPLQSNKAWTDAADPKNEKRAAMQANSTLFLNKELTDEPVWDEAQIVERSNRLFSLAKAVWPLGE